MKPVFPATYSTLCPVALSSLISERYHLVNTRCKLMVRGVGDTYLVEADDACFILRIYRSSHRNLPQIKDEVDLLLALKQAGVSVSYPIPDIAGVVIQALDAIEGTRYAVLFSYASGSVVKVLNENQLRTFGNEMARFHNVSSTIASGNERWHFNFETTVSKPLQMLRPAFAGDTDTYIWLQQAAMQIEKKLSETDTTGFSKGYCHFDFLPKNFHFEGDKITFFDFDFMGHGWLINDIMSFWQHLSLEVYAGRMTQQKADSAYAVFLDGYREYRSLSEDELATVPYLALGFWLFYMGFHTTHDQFYTFSQPAYLNLFTGFLKYLGKTYWGLAEV